MGGERSKVMGMTIREAMVTLRELIAAEVQDEEQINKLANDINHSPTYVGVSIDRREYDNRLVMIPFER